MKIAKLLIIMVLLNIVLVMAQVPDTLLIPYTTPPEPGLIKQVIEADTNTAGENLNRVYLLERGGIYIFNEPVRTNGGHVQVIGQEEPSDTPPAFLVAAVTPSGTSINRACFFPGGDFTVKNIAWTNVSSDQKATNSGYFIRMKKDSSTCVLENLYGDYTGGFYRADASYQRLFVDNVFVRNGGGMFSGSSNIHREVSISNTTFMNTWMIAWVGGPNGLVLDSLRQDHQTCVFTYWGPFQWGHHSNTEVKNGVYYDVAMRGDNELKRLERPDQFQDTAVQWVSLDSIKLATLGIDSSQRKIELANYCFYDSEVLTKFYADDDSLWMAVHIRPRMITDFIDNPEYPLITMTNIIEEDPGFVNLPHDASIHFAQLLNMIGLPKGPAANRGRYDADGDGMPQTLAWPHTVGMDLTITNPNMINAGTDGFNFGDLAHWAPDQYELWKAQKTTGVKSESNTVPNDITLAQNYPNPFNPTTTIEFTLQRAGEVNVAVFNMIGQKVKTLVNKKMTNGSHHVVWNGLDESGQRVASGVYYYRLDTKDFSTTRKMVLLK